MKEAVVSDLIHALNSGLDRVEGDVSLPTFGLKDDCFGGLLHNPFDKKHEVLDEIELMPGEYVLMAEPTMHSGPFMSEDTYRHSIFFVVRKNDCKIVYDYDSQVTAPVLMAQVITTALLGMSSDHSSKEKNEVLLESMLVVLIKMLQQANDQKKEYQRLFEGTMDLYVLDFVGSIYIKKRDKLYVKLIEDDAIVHQPALSEMEKLLSQIGSFPSDQKM